MELFLLRHAKSSWDDPYQRDFDRPLNPRGKNAAPMMGQVIKDKGIKPSKILCSPAQRTRETLELLNQTANLDSSIEFVDGIYEASTGELRKILRNVKQKHESVLMIGHNPGMEGLANDLTGDYERFPTAALASISLNIDAWKDLDPATGVFNWIITPKSLKQ